MRILPAALCIVLAAAGCKKKSDAVPADAAVAAADASAMSAVTASTAVRRGPPPMPGDAGIPTPPAAGASTPALPLASERMELVAVGKGWGSKIIWLQVHGDRVWLSGRNIDAYADGDGSLAKGPDLLAGLDYKPGVHGMRVTGAWPRLFLLRYRNVQGSMESPEATAFVYRPADGGAGTWVKAKPLGSDSLPWGFVGYRDSALLVYSQNEYGGMPMYSPPYPGTTIDRLDPDGSVVPAGLDVPHWFMAWSASADGGVLSLLGTTAQSKITKTDDGVVGGSGFDLVRVGPEGTKTYRFIADIGNVGQLVFGSHVHERNGKTVLVPFENLDGESWKPNGHTSWVLENGKPVPRTLGASDACSVVDTRYVGEALWSIRRCYGAAEWQSLARLGTDGKAERIALARLVKEGAGFRAARTKAEEARGFACLPESIEVRGTTDVWVRAGCGGGPGDATIPAVFRLGRAQEPLVLP